MTRKPKYLRKVKRKLQSGQDLEDGEVPKPTPKPLLIPEILSMVFDHMKAGDIAKCMTSCRSWAIVAIDDLWRKHPVPLRKIIEFLHPMEPKYKRGRGPRFWWWGEAATIDLFTPNNWEAFVMRTNMVTHVSMIDFTMMEHARSLLQSLIAQHPETRLFRKLRSVTLRNAHGQQGFVSTSWFLRVPTLRYIRADRFDPQNYFKVIEDAKDLTFKLIRIVPPNYARLKNLETLEVDANGHVKAVHLVHSLESMAKIEGLSKLNLIYSNTAFKLNTTAKDPASALRFPALVDLKIEVRGGLHLFLPHVNAPDVRTLKIDTKDDVGDDFADLVTNKFPNLEEFHAVVGNHNFRINPKAFARHTRKPSEGPSTAFMQRFFGNPLIRRLRFSARSDRIWPITDLDFGMMVKTDSTALQSLIFERVGSHPWLRTNLTVKSLVDVSEYQGTVIEELAIAFDATRFDASILQKLKSMPALGRLKVVIHVAVPTEQDKRKLDFFLSPEEAQWGHRWRHWPTFANAIVRACPALWSFSINITCEKNGYTTRGRDELPDFWRRYHKYWRAAKPKAT